MPVVRTVCSRPPRRPSPPGYSTWMRRSWRETSLAVAPSAAMRSGSRSTRISRATPPTRVTRPTPCTAESSRVTLRSTNHDSSVSVMLSDATLQVTIAPPAVVTRDTIGSFASAGQVGADARHRVAHVVERGRQVGAEAELDARRRRAVVDGRGHLLDARDRRDRVLDLARDLGFHLRRRDAGIGRR